MSPSLSAVAYLGATILFILCLGGLSNQETSRRGNAYGIVGMVIAVLATILGPHVTAGGLPYILGAMVVGATWYSPPLFAFAWQRALGKTREELGDAKGPIAHSMLMNLISAFTLGAVLRWQNVTTIADAMITSQALAVGLIVTNQLMHDRFNRATAQLSLINGAHTVVVYLAMGLVFGLLR